MEYHKLQKMKQTSLGMFSLPDNLLFT